MSTTSIPIQRSASARLINTSQQIDSISNEWDRTVAGNSATLTTTDSILAQSLPPGLAAPRGWHSELLESSLETNVSQSNNHFQTQDAANSSGIVYSSTSNADEIYHDIPTTTQHVVHEQSFGGATTHTNLHEHQTQFVQNIETQKEPPLILHRTIPNNKVTYQQNVSVRYLQPPTPPPPGPIIIREVRPPPPRPLTPVKIRQQVPPPPTPPPVVIRERPPPPPIPLPSQVVEKVLPPPPIPPRRMIVERFASCPPKPADVIIERWLPYRRSQQRRILYERAPAPFIPSAEPNLLVLHDQPRARIEKEFINQGVVRADPESYLQRYGAEIHSGYSHSNYSYLVDEAARNVPGPTSLPIPSHHRYSSSYYHDSPYPSYGSSSWDRYHSASPIVSHSSSYPWRYDEPYRSASRYPSDYHYSYDDYSRRSAYRPTMVDVTSSWSRHCRTPLPSHSYLPSYDTSRTIRVNSDGELRNVLDDLTGGRAPSPYRPY